MTTIRHHPPSTSSASVCRIPGFRLAQMQRRVTSKPQHPFTRGLGRCTPHLICGGANFSIYKLRSKRRRREREREKLQEFAFLVCTFATFFLRQLLHVVVTRVSCRKLCSSGLKEASGSERTDSFGEEEGSAAVFVHSFHRFLCWTQKAWEHKSPKPPGRRKLRWKRPQKARLWLPRQTDR